MPDWATRIGIALARARGRPFRLGSTVIAATHADVIAALARDLDFRIQPVNAAKFDQIGFHFILGMDRSAELVAERRALYTALAHVDMATPRADAAVDIATRLDAADDATGKGTIDAVEGYARPVAAATAARLLGIATDDPTELMDAARAVFGNSFLNPGGDAAMTARALAGADRLSDLFEAEIARRHAACDLGDDMMDALLAAGAAPLMTSARKPGAACRSPRTCLATRSNIRLALAAPAVRVRR